LLHDSINACLSKDHFQQIDLVKSCSVHLVECFDSSLAVPPLPVGVDAAVLDVSTLALSYPFGCVAPLMAANVPGVDRLHQEAVVVVHGRQDVDSVGCSSPLEDSDLAYAPAKLVYGRGLPAEEVEVSEAVGVAEPRGGSPCEDLLGVATAGVEHEHGCREEQRMISVHSSEHECEGRL
jgi:hypothetical protein